MSPPALNYTTPHQHQLEWRLLRGSAGVLLFVFGWFCFSLYLWYRLGSHGSFFKPVLRIARDLCLPDIRAATLLMTGLNLIHLLFHLKSSKRPPMIGCLYLTVALAPLACLMVNEHFFGDFVVE